MRVELVVQVLRVRIVGDGRGLTESNCREPDNNRGAQQPPDNRRIDSTWVLSECRDHEDLRAERNEREGRPRLRAQR